MTEMMRMPSDSVARLHRGQGPTRAVEDTEWNGDVLDLSDHVPPPEDGLLAQMLRAVNGIVRRGGSYRRRRVGWRAYPARIEFVNVSQPLVPRADGRFSPNGPWRAEISLAEARERPVLRRGDVPADEIGGGAEERSGRSVTEHARDRSLAELAYLPRVVREGFAGALADAPYIEAETVRHVRADGSEFFRTVALRSTPTHAVLLIASRQGGASAWQVEQRDYLLDEVRQEISP